jgi:hypothetical protein
MLTIERTNEKSVNILLTLFSREKKTMFVHWCVGLICDEWKEKVVQTHKINWFLKLGYK